MPPIPRHRLRQPDGQASVRVPPLWVVDVMAIVTLLLWVALVVGTVFALLNRATP